MGQPILEVEHLKKSYVNNVPILDDVSFSLQKGEVVVIVGPSGCGKSTFLRCINRLEEIDTGVLKLNGVSYEKEKKNISKVREKIGMVFQSYDLFPNMTILNNLLLAPMKVQKRNKEEVKKEQEETKEKTEEEEEFETNEYYMTREDLEKAMNDDGTITINGQRLKIEEIADVKSEEIVDQEVPFLELKQRQEDKNAKNRSG